jgi:hypothetical protein
LASCEVPKSEHGQNFKSVLEKEKLFEGHEPGTKNRPNSNDHGPVMGKIILAQNNRVFLA